MSGAIPAAATESAPISGVECETIETYAISARGIQDRGAYFAGICWKRIRAMQEIAEQIVAGDDAP